MQGCAFLRHVKVVEVEKSVFANLTKVGSGLVTRKEFSGEVLYMDNYRVTMSIGSSKCIPLDGGILFSIVIVATALH